MVSYLLAQLMKTRRLFNIVGLILCVLGIGALSIEYAFDPEGSTTIRKPVAIILIFLGSVLRIFAIKTTAEK